MYLKPLINIRKVVQISPLFVLVFKKDPEALINNKAPLADNSGKNITPNWHFS